MCWETGKDVVTAPPPRPNRRRHGSRKVRAQLSNLALGHARDGSGLQHGGSAESTSEVRWFSLNTHGYSGL